MPTIASMANRLDMSPEEAVETLRKLRVDIDGVDSEITGEQCDILMDVDEDPSTLDRLLKEILDKEEQDRKRTERLQKAAKKAAAKRKATAKKKPAAKKKTAAKKKPAAKKAPSKKKPAAETEAAPAEEEAEKPAEKRAAEVVPEEETPEEAAPPEEKPAQKFVAEILPEEPPEAPAEGEEAGAGAPAQPEGAKDAGGLLAEAERRHEEAERRHEEAERRRKERREKEESEKTEPEGEPLPQPDPEVVADVIRKAEERKREKKDRTAEPSAKDAPAEVLGKPDKGGQRPGRERARAPRKPAATGKTARKRKRRAERAREMEETMRRDAAAAVKEFEKGVATGGRKRRKRRDRSGETTGEAVPKILEVEEGITLEQLANQMEMPVNDLILDLMDEEMMATKNQVLDIDTIRKIAEGYDYDVRLVIPEEEEVLAEEEDKPEDLQLRPPVITVMGHVDHGKTSFLDRVRSASVAAGEAGGITQHIAAYDVEIPTGRVVFLDTPGHEAFTHMRARGSQVTDVVVLIVAADDGVKPQTIEAIDHAKAAEVPIVVAVNKCDKPDAAPDRVRQELTQYELVPEEWGGKTIMRDISCQTGEGIDDLLEMLGLESEMLELKANPNKSARGAVVEAEISRGQGAVAWVLVQSGTLRVGDSFLCGETYGRVRTMTDSRNKHVEEAGPSTPVLVTGFTDPPNAGDALIVVKEERLARDVAAKRAALTRQKRGPGVKRMTLEDFHQQMAGEAQKTLNVVLKADVQGSVDVLESSLKKLGNEEVSLSVVHAGVGGVNESDVMLASASEAVIIGFHVTANARVQKLAEQEGIEIRTYRVIYEAIDDVKSAMEGLLTPESREIVMGHAEIRQVFRSPALGHIAGCYHTDGQTERGAHARLIRDDVVMWEGRIGTLRRGKDDVKTVSSGYECGINLEGFDDIQEGDVIECFKIEQVAKTLA